MLAGAVEAAVQHPRRGVAHHGEIIGAATAHHNLAVALDGERGSVIRAGRADIGGDLARRAKGSIQRTGGGITRYAKVVARLPGQHNLAVGLDGNRPAAIGSAKIGDGITNIGATVEAGIQHATAGEARHEEIVVIDPAQHNLAVGLDGNALGILSQPPAQILRVYTSRAETGIQAAILIKTHHGGIVAATIPGHHNLVVGLHRRCPGHINATGDILRHQAVTTTESQVQRAVAVEAGQRHVKRTAHVAVTGQDNFAGGLHGNRPCHIVAGATKIDSGKTHGAEGSIHRTIGVITPHGEIVIQRGVDGVPRHQQLAVR